MESKIQSCMYDTDQRRGCRLEDEIADPRKVTISERVLTSDALPTAAYPRDQRYLPISTSMSAIIFDSILIEWSTGKLCTIHCIENQSGNGQAEDGDDQSRGKSQIAVPEGIVVTSY